MQHPRIHPGHHRQGSTHAVCSGTAHKRRCCTSLFAALLFEPLPLQQPAHQHHIHSIIASQSQCLLVRHCGRKVAMHARRCGHMAQPRSGCSCVASRIPQVSQPNIYTCASRHLTIHHCTPATLTTKPAAEQSTTPAKLRLRIAKAACCRAAQLLSTRHFQQCQVRCWPSCCTVQYCTKDNQCSCCVCISAAATDAKYQCHHHNHKYNS